jgi:hypothetical protein
VATGAQGRVAPADLPALAGPAGRRAGAPAPGALLVDEYDGIWFLIYSGTRRGGAPSYHLVLRPGDPIQPSDRDIWLTQSGHCTQGIIANKNHLNKTSIGFTK